ncbi:MAG TPA: hypothetical protein VL099_14220 [Candidatus Binatia bacterium]|nr:hypothetical protein [Candidatus Binatia bacterium]
MVNPAKVAGRGLRRVTCFLLLAGCAGAASAQVPQPGVGTNARPSATVPRGPLPVFALYSSFWVNLHHVLYAQARLRSERPIVRSQDKPPVDASLPRLEDLSGKEQHDWNSALDEYAERMAPHDLQFDEDMVRINNRLSEMGDAQTAEETGFLPPVIAALAKAAPIYQKHWWPQDDHANRVWIDAVAPLVEELGAQISRQLSSIYRAPWPKGPIHVDVAAYAGVYGGYTTLDPLHITVSSRDPRNQSLAGFELLFHEASHGLADPVRAALNHAFQAQAKPIPRDLWHALLFYTTGEVVRNMLAGAGHSTYSPYAEQNHLYERDWQNYQRALDRDWAPYLQNHSDFSTAIRKLVDDL